MDLSPEGKGRVVLMTSVGTIVCIVFVIIVDSFNFPQLSPTQLLHSLVTDIVVPTALCVQPVYCLVTYGLPSASEVNYCLRRCSRDSDCPTSFRCRASKTIVEGQPYAQIFGTANGVGSCTPN